MVAAGSDLFIQIGIVVVIAAFLAFLSRLIKQPQLIAYILVGILITPVFNLVTDTSLIQSMSIIGIAFLLFLVGVEIDLKKLKNVAMLTTFGGLIQITMLFVTGYLLAILLGFLSLEAAYLGLMFAFSSTMIVMKFLSDKRQINTLHGRIVVGILLMEDIVAIFALSILASVDGFIGAFFGIALLKFATVFFLAYISSKFIFPVYFKFAAKHQELLFISAVGVCFLFSLLFHYLGFSIAIGAFIAGLTLGNLEYNYEIIGKLKSLRDFFALLFFVSLGMGLSIAVLKTMLIPLIVFLAFIILFKPFLVTLISTIFKYTKKPAFLSGLYLSQIGEFSLIIAAQGLLLGQLSNDIFSMIVIITLASITVTSYLIKYSDKIYSIMEKPLKIFDNFSTQGLEYLPTEVKPTIILAGHNRIGYSILKSLKKVKKKVLIVDYNPEIIAKMVKQGYHCIYGEVDDSEIMDRMNLKNIKHLISTVPYPKENLVLIRKTREVNKKAWILVTATNIEDALRLYKAGADYVIMPHFLGGEKVADIVTALRHRKINMKKEREMQINMLKSRRSIGHELPTHQ